MMDTGRTHALLIRILLSAVPLLAMAQEPGELPKWDTPPRGTLDDTVRVDLLLDSTKAWVGAGETDRPVVYAEEALRLLGLMTTPDAAKAKRDRREMQANKLCGIAHHYAGRYAKALRSFQQFHDVAERLGDSANAAAALNYQAYEYRSMDELLRARERTETAIAILNTLHDESNLANAHSGLGNILADMGRLDSALIEHRAALALYERSGLDQLAGLCRMDHADVFMMQNDSIPEEEFLQKGAYDSAYYYLEQARPVLEADPNPNDRCIFLVLMSEALYGLGRTQEAMATLTEAEQLLAEVDNSEHRSRVNELMALVLSATGNRPEALRRLAAMRSAIIADQDLTKAKEMTEVRMEAEQQEERQKAAMRLENERVQKRNAFIGGALVLLVALLLLWLLVSARRNGKLLRQKNEAIQRAQEHVVALERQREAGLVRTRIARDVHDQLGSDLTKLVMLSGEAKALADKDSVALLTIADDLERIAGEANGSLGDIVWAIDPHHDSVAALNERVRAHCERMLKWSRIPHTIDCAHHGPDGSLDPATKRDIYLVLREALNNAIKYSKAQHIQVTFRTDARTTTMAVTDDGVGFDPEQMRDTGHGLASMRARAERIHGHLVLESAVGKGTRVSLEATIVL